jgi:hypothetical protein
MSSPRITYTSRPDATPETEASVLASVYAFLLDTANKKAAAHALDNGPNDVMEISSDYAATKNYTR